MSIKNVYRIFFVFGFLILIGMIGHELATAAAPQMIDVDEDITVDTTFVAGATYIIKCENFCTLADDFEITVENGATLTVEPGAKIVLESTLGVADGSQMLLGSIEDGEPIVEIEGDFNWITFYSGSAGHMHGCLYSGGGVVVDGAVSALRIFSSAVEIDSCTFTNHNGDVLEINGDGLSPKISNLTLIANAEQPHLSPILQDPDAYPIYSNVSFSGFDANGVRILQENNPCDLNPMNEINVSGLIDGRGLNGAPYYFGAGGIKIAEGVEVDVAAGTTVLVGPCVSGGRVVVDGKLTVSGTVNAPVIFDAWGDGWNGMTISEGGSADLNHCHLLRDNIVILSSDVEITHCEFDAGGASDGRPAIYIGDGNIRPTLSYVTATGSTDYGIEQHPNSSPIYNDVTLIGNERSQVKMQTNDDSLFSDFSVVEVAGVVWDGSGLNGAGIYVPGLNIEEQAGLKIAPGTKIELWEGQSIDVYGSLVVTGTEELVSTITSWTEDFSDPTQAMYWGFISVRPGATATFEHCDIKFGTTMVYVNQNTSVSIRNCRIHQSHYATGSGIVVEANATIENNAIYNHARYGVHVKSNATPLIRFNNFYNNGLYAIYNETPDGRTAVATVDARENWWGVSTGPSLTGNGLGDRVSDGVLYSPWLTAPNQDTPALPAGGIASIYLPITVR